MSHRNRHRWHEFDSKTLLEELGAVRERLHHRYSPKALFVKPLYAALGDLSKAIDAVAEQLTGDKEFFWAKHHSSGSMVADPEVALVPQREEDDDAPV